MVWKFNVLKTNSKGGIERDITFGNNSYYWIDYNGLHFHFDSLNDNSLDDTEDAVTWFISSVIQFTCPIAIKQSSIFADKLIKTVKYKNPKSTENIDIFISWKSLAMIIEHKIMPELNNIKVHINGFYYDIQMSYTKINYF